MTKCENMQSKRGSAGRQWLIPASSVNTFFGRPLHTPANVNRRRTLVRAFWTK